MSRVDAAWTPAASIAATATTALTWTALDHRFIEAHDTNSGVDSGDDRVYTTDDVTAPADQRCHGRRRSARASRCRFPRGDPDSRAARGPGILDPPQPPVRAGWKLPFRQPPLQ